MTTPTDAPRQEPSVEDLLAAGLDPWTATREDLDAVVAERQSVAAQTYAEQPEDQDQDQDQDQDGSSWTPERLDAYLDGTLIAPTPNLLIREDEQALLYRGKIHTFQGDSEACKTWLALHAAAQVLQDGGRVVYIDYEDCAATLVERLLALGVAPDAIRNRCFYIAPRTWDMIGVTLHKTLLPGMDLVIVDAVTEAMASMGLDPLNAAHVALWAGRLRTFASAGCAVVQIDHVTKNSETRGRYALGSVHKLNSVDGAAYVVEGIRPFGRGMTGHSRVSLAKDRPGAVRGSCGGNRVGELHLVSNPDSGAVTIRLEAPEVSITTSGAFRPTILMQRVSAVLATGPDEGQSGNQIENQVTGKAATVRQAVEALVEEGYVKIEQVGQKKMHTLIRPFEGDRE